MHAVPEMSWGFQLQDLPHLAWTLGCQLIASPLACFTCYAGCCPPSCPCACSWQRSECSADRHADTFGTGGQQVRVDSCSQLCKASALSR